MKTLIAALPSLPDIPGALLASFRVKAKVILTAEDISAYDNEAACRYARESLEEVRNDIGIGDLDFGFSDGLLRGAVFALPSHLDIEATLTDGEEEDPEGTMDQAEFSIEVVAMVTFEVEAPARATPEQIITLASALLSGSKAVEHIAFDDGCIGSTLRLASPIKVSLADSGN